MLHCPLVYSGYLGVGLVGRSELSEKQSQVLETIRRHILEHGYPPSIREIGQALGLRSSSTIHAHLTRLERRGLIRRDPTKPRAIELIDPETYALSRGTVMVPLIGRVAAGTPLLATQNVDDALPLPREFVGSGRHFLLRVQGDSMVNAGIMDGDYLLIQERATAENGEIVVALVDGEATVKRFHRDEASQTIRLEPENPRYQPLVVEKADVVGRVAALLRRY